MNIAGIIAEFNPLHSGHKYLIDSALTDGAECVVCVMSGNFVQRGDAAIFSKWARTKAALSCGADLVIELPVRYCVATAMKFALGGVSLLDAVGTDCIYFGSECGQKKLISDAADKIIQNDEKIVELLKSGISYATARQEACGCDILSNPNDTLGVEYVSAIKKLGSNMDFKPMKRVGAAHDSEQTDSFCSSSYLRKNLDKLVEFSPAYNIFKDEDTADLSKAERALLIKLRQMSAEEICNLPDISEGLGMRIFNAVKCSASVAEVIENSQSKRYTQARIRRILLCALLGIDKSDISSLPPYVKVLGMTDKGRQLLKTAKLPIIARFSDTKALDINAQQEYNLECKADDVYALLLNKPLPCGTTKTNSIIKE